MKQKLPYVCPVCRGILFQDDDGYHCEANGHRWPVREGIPCFTRREVYWNDLPKEEMQRLIEIGSQHGWRTVYYDHLRRRYPKAELGIIGDERRTDWLFLLDLDETSVCLDIGTGWGATAFGMADRCCEVFAVDATWERLRMLDLRRRQENFENVHPVYGGAELQFPFPPESFDLVSLVGVLEWIPQWKRDLPPRECQLEALRVIHELLKPGGQVYIAIENRIGYNYLMGRRDHNGLRFASLMPRFLADIVSRAFTGDGYRTYQYTMWGYRRLLQQSGFGEFEFFATVPNYRDPYVYIPVDSPGAQEFFVRQLFDTFTLISPERKKEYAVEYLAARLALKAGTVLPVAALLGLFTPGFGIIARKTGMEKA